MLRQGHQWSLPNYAHWPQHMEPKKNQWPLALARHVTHDLLETWPEPNRHKCFGLPKGSACYRFMLSKEAFGALSSQCLRIQKWAFRYADAKFQWSTKAMSIDSILNCSSIVIDTQSAHCLREVHTKDVQPKDLAEDLEKSVDHLEKSEATMH